MNGGGERPGTRTDPGSDERGRDARGGDDERGAGGRRSFSEGVRQVNAVLSAFKEAVEESLQDARDRGDLSTERAREVMQGALARARDAAGEARERLDFATQKELEALEARVGELRARLERLERGGAAHTASAPPEPEGGEDPLS